jgi:hypothetical protein
VTGAMAEWPAKPGHPRVITPRAFVSCHGPSSQISGVRRNQAEQIRRHCGAAFRYIGDYCAMTLQLYPDR